MINLRKKLALPISALLLSCLAAYTTSANDSTEAKLDGLFHFQSAFRNQNKLLSSEKNVSGNRQHFAFYTEATIAATLAKTVNDLRYGTKLVLVPTTYLKTSCSYNGSHIFLESEFGKVEFGSPIDSGSKMMIGAYDIAAATGDDWGRYANLSSSNIQYLGVSPEFVTFYGQWFGYHKSSLSQISDGSEPPRLVSYFTPKFNGFQLGISYIPDTSNVGSAAADKYSVDQPMNINGPRIKTMAYDRNAKDCFTGGISYEHNISDGVDLKLALTGEANSNANKAPKVTVTYTDNTTKTVKLSPLRGYNVGGILTYCNMSYNLAYGSLGKSWTSSEYNKTGRDTNYYGGSIAYGQGPIKSSISYFRSSQYKNTLNFVSFGAAYNIMPGLSPYAELSYFKAKGKPSIYPEAPRKETKGTMMLIGAKLKL